MDYNVTNGLFDQFRTSPSYVWSLELIGCLGGLCIILEWNDDVETVLVNKVPEFKFISLRFVYPASWAHTNLSQTWQPPPENMDTPVLRTFSHESTATFSPGFTIHEELEREYLAYRIIAFDDLIDVISFEPPEITAYNKEPEILTWWNDGGRTGKIAE